MIGRQISQYRVIEKIGEGGMGVVYKADDTVLRRPVVLKFLPPEHQASQERIDRFLREARSASALNHPNIVTMHNVVQEESTICLVMEFVDGQALDEITPRTGLPVDEVLGYAVQITDALAAAHAAGIIHRDIKPGNVMVLPSGAIKVLDFGLAKLDPLAAVDSEGRTETLMTQAGRVIGTPAYMSPEQVLGSAVDARSDIFSCGAMLYELLTGSRPFQATGSNSVLHAIVQEREVPVTDLREDLPPALGVMLAKSLAKSRGDRFQSMEEMRDALRRVQSAIESGDATLELDQISGLEDQDAGKPAASGDRPASGRGRWITVAAALVALALVIWLLPGTREALRGWLGSGSDEKATESESSATVEPETAFEFVQRGNGLLDHFYRTGYVDQAVVSFQQALALEPESASAYAGLAEAYWRQYRRDKDPELLTRARTTIDEAIRLDPHLTAAQVTRGFIRLTAGEKVEARADFEEVVELDPANARAHLGLGNYHRGEGNVEAAESEYRQAAELRPEDHRPWEAMGILYYRNARYADAEAAFAASVERAPDLVGAFRNLAAVQHMQGRYSEAAASLQRALEIDPDPRTYSNLGTLYFFQGLYQKALMAFESAIEEGANDYRIWGNLGDAYRWTPGNEQKAQETFETAIRLVREAIAETGPDGEKSGLLAEFLAKTGDSAGALAELESFESNDPYDYFNAAQAAEIAGARDLALELLDQALASGLSLEEVRKDPELAELRKDSDWQLLLTRAEERAES